MKSINIRNHGCRSKTNFSVRITCGNQYFDELETNHRGPFMHLNPSFQRTPILSKYLCQSQYPPAAQNCQKQNCLKSSTMVWKTVKGISACQHMHLVESGSGANESAYPGEPRRIRTPAPRSEPTTLPHPISVAWPPMASR